MLAGYAPGMAISQPPTVTAATDLEGATPAQPILGDILRRARHHHGLSLRQVEQRIGIPNAHLSQIERGTIRRPDVTMLMDLAELYQLDYRLVAEWAGYLDPASARTSGPLAGMALRLFVELDPRSQQDALVYLERLRNQTGHDDSARDG
jgi:HTH-type transcriptional regulator, competence development regulator